MSGIRQPSDDKDLEWGELWCAVHMRKSRMVTVRKPNIGFCPYPSGMSMNWDREKYPYLSLLDNTVICHDADVTDEVTYADPFYQQAVLHSGLCRHYFNDGTDDGFSEQIPGYD